MLRVDVPGMDDPVGYLRLVSDPIEPGRALWTLETGRTQETRRTLETGRTLRTGGALEATFALGAWLAGSSGLTRCALGAPLSGLARWALGTRGTGGTFRPRPPLLPRRTGRARLAPGTRLSLRPPLSRRALGTRGARGTGRARLSLRPSLPR